MKNGDAPGGASPAKSSACRRGICAIILCSTAQERKKSMATGKALDGKPYAGNPHVRLDEGEVAPCTAEASLWRVHCRRQPEGRASVCAATSRRGSLLCKRSRITFAAIVAASAAFAAPMLIPAPREMSVTGGRVAIAAADAPKVEVVASIPPEGYELSITTNGVTIRHSDDARLRGVCGPRGGTPPPPHPRTRQLRPAEVVLQYSGC